MGSQLLTSRESETAGNCEREVADDQDFLLAAVVGLCWNCALDLCFLRHTITRSSHYYFSFLLPLSLWSLCLKYWDRDFWTKIHPQKATMQKVNMYTYRYIHFRYNNNRDAKTVLSQNSKYFDYQVSVRISFEPKSLLCYFLRLHACML